MAASSSHRTSDGRQDSERTGEEHEKSVVRSLQAQIKFLQNQHRTAEEQLNRSMQRERELREQAANADMMGLIAKLRRENKELRELSEETAQRLETLRGSETSCLTLQNRLDAAQEELARSKQYYQQEMKRLQGLMLLRTISLTRSNCSDENEELKEDLKKINHFEKLAESAKNRRAVREERAGGLLHVCVGVERREQVREMAEARSKTNDMISNLNETSRETQRRASSLEEIIASMEKTHKDVETENLNLRGHNDKLMAQVRELEDSLFESQNQTTRLSQRLQACDKEVKSIQEESKRAQEALKKETNELLHMVPPRWGDNSHLTASQWQVEDLKTKHFETLEEYKTSESEWRRTREQLREEAREAEAENKKLRDQLRMEREKFEQSMKDHADAMTEQLDQRQKIEAAAGRREEALHRRLLSSEKELDALRSSSVPESKFRSLQQQLSEDKQLLLSQLDAAVSKASALESQRQAEREQLEQKLAATSADLEDVNKRMRALEKQVAEGAGPWTLTLAACAGEVVGGKRGRRTATANENSRGVPDDVQCHGRGARVGGRRCRLVQGNTLPRRRGLTRCEDWRGSPESCG
eukprot:747314-Hanusia_phi.AAC.9